MRPLAFQVAMVRDDSPSGKMLLVFWSVWALAVAGERESLEGLVLAGLVGVGGRLLGWLLEWACWLRLVVLDPWVELWLGVLESFTGWRLSVVCLSGGGRCLRGGWSVGGCWTWSWSWSLREGVVWPIGWLPK